MGYKIKQSQTSYPLTFLMVLSSDHISPATGKSPTVTLSKNGGSFASPAGAVAEIGDGWYKVAGNATDSGTLGPLLLHATEASSDPADEVFMVTTEVWQTGDVFAALPTNFSNTAITSGGIVSADLQTVKTQAVTCAAGVTVNPNVGTTQPVNFTGTNGTAYVKSDVVDIAGSAVSATTAQLGVNVVNIKGSATAGAAGYVAMDMAELLGSPRDVSAVADTLLTVNDALWGGLCGAMGKEAITNNTTYTVSTPSTGTAVRIFTLNSATAPTSRS